MNAKREGMEGDKEMENDRNGTANEGKEEGRQWDGDNDSDRSKTRGEGAKLEGERVEQGEGGGQM